MRRTWQIAVGIAAVETVALLVMIVAVGISAQNSQGATQTATVPEIIIYLLFAALLGLMTWGLIRKSPLARTPFVVTQLFGIVVAYTVLVGDGIALKILGSLIGIISVAGIVIAFTPSFVQVLTHETRSDDD